MSGFLLKNVRDAYGYKQDMVIQLDLVKYVIRCDEGRVLSFVFKDDTTISATFDNVNTCLRELVNYPRLKSRVLATQINKSV